MKPVNFPPATCWECTFWDVVKLESAFSEKEHNIHVCGHPGRTRPKILCDKGTSRIASGCPEGYKDEN
jgi:hypothetical protein